MASDVRIRRAELSEAEALSALAMRSKAMWGYDEDFMAMCREELTVQPDAIAGGDVWVAEDEGRLLGVLELTQEDDAVDVRLIFVEPGAVGTGIGRMLWDHAEARARALGAATLTVDADPNALGYYQRMGMRVIGRSPSGSIPGRTLPRLAKALAGEPVEEAAPA